MANPVVTSRAETEHVQRILSGALVNRGIDPASEAGRMLRDWVLADLARAEYDDWAGRLASAVDLGLDIYRDFNERFAEFFREGLDRATCGSGVRSIYRQLRRRFQFCGGSVPQRLVDAVLEIILNRRAHYLDAFRRRYQPSLFGCRTWEPKKTRGYLVRVVRNESYHIPPEEFPWVTHELDGLPLLGGICGVAPPHDARAERCRNEADEEPVAGDLVIGGSDCDSVDGFHARFSELTGQLARYWGRNNGFSRQELLEGLTSAGFGGATGIRPLEIACRKLLRAKLTAWNAVLEKMPRRLGQALARREALELQLRRSEYPREQFQISLRLTEAEQRLERLDQRVRKHWFRLRPTPGEVGHLLEGLVSNAGTVRFRRISREVALWERRVRCGGQFLRQASGAALPRTIARLVDRALGLLDSKPAESSSAHGLSDEERQRRARQEQAWQRRARQLLARTRQAWKQMDRFARGSLLERSARHWLADCEDLLEFGANREGVLRAVRHRQGWRLDHLLRVGI